MSKEISVQYSKALELHNKILVSAQLAQTNLWEMCSGLKEMRDGKLYRELGYQNFEEYCHTEFNMNRSNAHKYISIIENINPENVSTSKHFGVSKLYLLSTLSEAEQAEMTEKNDVESMTVKELEKEIKCLKEKNHQMDMQLDEQGDLLVEMRIKAADAKREKEEACEKVSRLQRKISELESRPVEVAVAEPSEDVRQLKLTIKNLEQSTEAQLEKMENDHIADVRKLHEQNRADMQQRLASQKELYEKKLAAVQQSASSDDKQVFKAYFTAAYDTFNRMVEFAKQSEDKDFFREKISNLLTTFTTANQNL